MSHRRIILAALACAAFGLASPAFAQAEPPSWLLKYISFYSNVGSNPPNIQEPTVIRLYGWFPYDYGHVGPAAVDDPGHIRLTLRPHATIALDTTRTWAADFDLGYLPLGDHTLTVTRTFVDSAGTDSVTESASFTFPVVDLGNPPPPPPPPPPGPPPPNVVVPYVSGWSTIPAQPNAVESTSVVLRGVFPYDCGEIVDAESDTGSIHFTMRQGSGCGDTTRTWTHTFALGLLESGRRTIQVYERLVSPDSELVVHGFLGFDVWQDPDTPPPTPPAPPEFPSVGIRCLSGWYTTAPPTIHEPTTLVLWGWYPYHCGELVDATVMAENHVSVTLRPKAEGCTDTTLTWSQSFDLGLLSAGPHQIWITLQVWGDPMDAVVARSAPITLLVNDQDVSQGIPNPFIANTRFVVSAPQGDEVDIGIFDLHGRRVKTIFQGRMAGAREFHWDGRRDDGSRAAIGIYFSRVAFSNRVVTRKLVMLPR